MKPLSQRSLAWAYITLGASKLTVGREGCLATCIAMDQRTTPDRIAKNDAYFTRDGVWVWPSAVGQSKLHYRGKPDWALVARWIRQGYRVLLETRLFDSQHWVLAVGINNGKVLINDPWYGDCVEFGKRYKEFVSMAMYAAPKPVAIPVQAKPIPNPIVPAPAELPTPDMPLAETPTIEPTQDPIPQAEEVKTVQIPEKYKSRKFLLVVLVHIFAIGSAIVGYLNSTQTITLLGLVNSVYVVVQGWLDSKN